MRILCFTLGVVGGLSMAWSFLRLDKRRRYIRAVRGPVFGPLPKPEIVQVFGDATVEERR